MPEDAPPPADPEPPTPLEAASGFERPRWDLVDALSVICLDAGALGIGALVARDLIGAEAHPVAAAFATAIVRPMIVLPALLFITRRWWGSPPAHLGLRRPGPGSWLWFAKFAGLVGLGYAALLGVVALAFHGRVGPQWFERVRSGLAPHVTGAALVPRALLMLVVAPLVEEPVFRGILQPALRRRLGRWGGVLACAAVFAGMHVVWSWRLFPPWTQLLGGLIFAWSYERTRSLVFPMVFHALGNAAILTWHLVLVHRPDWVQAVLM